MNFTTQETLCILYFFKKIDKSVSLGIAYFISILLHVQFLKYLFSSLEF